MKRALYLVALLLLGSCASAPSRINDVCAVFDQRDGWFNSWYGAAKKTEREFGVPVPILMATIYAESGFSPYARPPRTKLLGFIPWTRPSSAYGYSQALDGTWLQYQKETGNYSARRTDFGDAADFVGWYHNKSVRTLGIAPDDAYSLYLAYYHGHAGFARGSWRNNASIQGYARKTAEMAARYQAQMRTCW